MKIKAIITQSRRDFTADFECEHCGAIEQRSGYDDEYFHREVIPAMICKQCGKTSPENYRPLAPVYPEGVQV